MHVRTATTSDPMEKGAASPPAYQSPQLISLGPWQTFILANFGAGPDLANPDDGSS